jgi:hypothetical protein
VKQLTDLQQLYDSNRFLDAFRQSSDYWRPSTSIKDLSVEELILGGRLAMRLGGWRLSRRLFRAAHARDPKNPRVRYFSNHVHRRRSGLLEELREFEANPDVCSEDPEMQAAWLASHAVTWAFLRDFTRAHQCLERARALESRDGWVTSCESDVLGLEDRWGEALNCAERAWEIKPGTPHAARSLSNGLLNLGRVRECAGRLSAGHENSQPYEVVQLARRYQCALAETLDGDERRRYPHGRLHVTGPCDFHRDRLAPGGNGYFLTRNDRCGQFDEHSQANYSDQQLTGGEYGIAAARTNRAGDAIAADVGHRVAAQAPGQDAATACGHCIGVLSLGAIMGSTGCAGGTGTITPPSTSYTVVVTAHCGTLQQSVDAIIKIEN